MGVVAAAPASGAVYWGAFDGSFRPPAATVGAANLDGGTPIQNYLAGLETPGSTGAACGVSVDDSYLYWAGSEGIGRVNLDGPALPVTIVPNLHRPCGLTVDHAHIYWGNFQDGAVGRANLDGSEANLSFIAGLNRPCDVAVADGHLYWAERDGIGRANLDGSEPEHNFLSVGPLSGCAIAVRDGYLYWGENEAIARIRLNGTELDGGFIADTGEVEGIATDAGHVYWVDHPPRSLASIGRTNLDGSEPNRAWIPSDPNEFPPSAQSNLLGVAVDGRPSPPPLLRPARPIRFGKVTHYVRSGRASIEVWVPDRGELEVSAPGLACRVISDSTPHPARGGALRWRAFLHARNGKLGKRVRAKLKRKGVVPVTLSATFSTVRTPTVGAVRRLKLRLSAKPDRE